MTALSENLHGRGRPGVFVAWLVGERVVRAAASAVALAVVARHLGPAGFGTLNFALMIVGMAMPLAQLGLDTAVVRELVRRPAEASALLGTATVLRLGSGVACAAAVYLAAWFVPTLHEAEPVLRVVAWMLAVQAFETPDLWFRGQVTSWPTTLARGTAVVASAAAKCVLAYAGAPLIDFAWLSLAELVAFQAGLWLAYRRDFRLVGGWCWNVPLARRLCSECAWYAVAATIGGIAFRVDQLMVATWLGEAAAGVYFAALRLIEIPTFIAVSTAAALFPALASGDPLKNGRYESTTGVLIALGGATAVAFSVLAPWGVPLVFGREYEAAVGALVLRSWAMLPFFGSMVRTQWLTVARRPGAQFALVVAGFAVHLAFNAWLIPRWGIDGASGAFLLTELASAWILPALLPGVRASLRPQFSGWLLPLRPAWWRQLLRERGSTQQRGSYEAT
jgi:PST family polysaccharide transporter